MDLRVSGLITAPYASGLLPVFISSLRDQFSDNQRWSLDTPPSLLTNKDPLQARDYRIRSFFGRYLLTVSDDGAAYVTLQNVRNLDLQTVT